MSAHPNTALPHHHPGPPAQNATASKLTALKAELEKVKQQLEKHHRHLADEEYKLRQIRSDAHVALQTFNQRFQEFSSKELEVMQLRRDFRVSQQQMMGILEHEVNELLNAAGGQR